MKPATELPATLPIFPLTGAVLLPRGRLPLNIFEPRYLALVEDAFAAGRLIGMIQPKDEAATSDTPPLYEMGCAGRIVSFAETDPTISGGRMLIMLQGVARFNVLSEIPTMRGYRRVQPLWIDVDNTEEEEPLSRAVRGALLDAVKPYFKRHALAVNWETLEEATPERLVASLITTCPFESREKQALLEAPTLESRTELLLTLLKMAVQDRHAAEAVCH